MIMAFHHMPHAFQIYEVSLLPLQLRLKDRTVLPDRTENIVLLQSLWQHIDHLRWIRSPSAFFV